MQPCDQSTFLNTPTSLNKKQKNKKTKKRKKKKEKHKHKHKQKYKEKQVSLFCKELAELIVFIFIGRCWRTSGSPTRRLQGPLTRQPCTTTPRTSSIIPPRWPHTTTPRTSFIIPLWGTNSNSKPFKPFLQSLKKRLCQLGPLQGYMILEPNFTNCKHGIYKR